MCMLRPMDFFWGERGRAKSEEGKRKIEGFGAIRGSFTIYRMAAGSENRDGNWCAGMTWSG